MPDADNIKPGDMVRVLGRVTHVEGNAIAVHIPGNIGTTIVHRQHVKAEERDDA
jgi:hypothetical protein